MNPSAHSQHLNEYADRLLAKFEQLGVKLVHGEDGLIVFQIDASEIFRRLDSPVSLILTTYSKVEEGLVNDEFWLDMRLEEFIRSNLLPLVLMPPGDRRNCLRLLNKTLVQGQPILNINRLLSGRDPVKAFRDEILEKINSLEFLSPYRTDTAARGKMFVGREALLQKLLHRSGNHFIVGARRIGKSTLAIHVQNELGFIDSNQTRLRSVSRWSFKRCAYVDVSALGRDVSNRLWREIIRKFDLDFRSVMKFGRRMSLLSTRHEENPWVSDALVLDGIIAQCEGKLTIILDEVDGWIKDEAASGWRTIDQLRALTDNGRVKVILVGYESLMAAVENVRFPFFMRGETTLLGPIGRAAIDDLVRLPLAELNVRLEPESEMLETIWQETSGIPHLVQAICAELLTLCVGGSQRKAVLTNRDLSTALSNATSLSSFRKGVFGGGFPLAEFIAGITAFTLHRPTEMQTDDCPDYLTNSKSWGKDYITTGGIRDLLDEANYQYDNEDFDSALNNLKLNLILRAIDEAETMWTWVNQRRRETMIASVEGLGFQRWENDNKKKHHNGKWKETLSGNLQN